MKKEHFLQSEGFKTVAASVLSILIGLAVGSIVILIVGLTSPNLSLSSAWDGIRIVFGGLFSTGRDASGTLTWGFNPTNIGNMLFRAAPLIMTGLSVGMAYKTGLFNIGAPGQYLIGTLVSLSIALGLPSETMSTTLIWLLAFLGGTLAGAIWGAIPGLFKALLNINEVLACIMTNWIAANLVTWLFDISNFKNVTESTKTGYIYKTTYNGVATAKMGLDKLFPNSQVNGGILIAIVFAIAVYVMMSKTTFGYQLKACGSNRHAARYAGIADKRNIVISMAIAGGLSAAGASLYYLSGNTEFFWSTYQSLPAIGFNGIPVAMLASCNPIGIIFTALFMSMLDISGLQLTNLTAYNEYITNVIIAVIGGTMAIAGTPNLGLTGMNTLTLGMIASFLTLSRGFTNPISQISNQFNSIVTALAGASRIFAFMDAEPETDDGYVTLVNAKEENGMLAETDHHTGLWAWKHPHGDGTVTYTKLAGRVVFDHVDFGYTPDKEVLHDITLYAEPGQKVAFVGATGAGKTTITNLINRFYDIADGKIRYDGININKIRKADLRRSLGIVLQDVNLFTGTVMENIRYGNPAATDDECIAAAKLANADHFIRMLPDGYNTVLKGDGSGLSQGQRQLLSIARAAVSDPPVMILDEATSSIDTRTEALVQSGMDKLMEGRTVFVIAHRLSTVKNADVIMVLDHGRIIERGNHAKLIAETGVYYQLYTGAFELE